MDKKDIEFLGKRLAELRKQNDCNSMQDMADRINRLNGITEKGTNKSSISRVEAGTTSEKTLLEYFEIYCTIFHQTEAQKAQLLRGGKIAIPDTSALLRNTQLIDELNEEYSRVIIPKVVIDELNRIKNKNAGSSGRKAWEAIRGISYGDKNLMIKYDGPSDEDNDDCKIIYVAEAVSKQFSSKVDILTYDTDYSAYLKGNNSIAALYLREYMATKQHLINMDRVLKINAYYADSYDDVEIPTVDEVNAYMSDGNTLLIACVREKRKPVEQRKAKIRWLIKHGADVNKRACGGRFLPALSQAIQMRDDDGGREMFEFLLGECHADPNVGSRNPLGSGKVRQKNEGNMPLMIAAWHGKTAYVERLCSDERISINQQDENGFTALIKACANGNFKCKDVLIKHGADTKIVDIDGKTFQDHIDEYHELGPLKDRGTAQRNKNRGRRKSYTTH